MDKLLDTRQAAERLGLARGTLSKLRLNGGGPAYIKLGAKVLYRESALEAWLNAHPDRSSTSDLVDSGDDAHDWLPVD